MEQGLSEEEVAAALLPTTCLPEPEPEVRVSSCCGCGMASVPKTNEIDAQEDELEDVRWFHRDFLAAALAGTRVLGAEEFSIPGEYALAGKAIREWCSRRLASDLDVFADVAIDVGTFKYVLLRLTNDQGEPRGELRARLPPACADGGIHTCRAEQADRPGRPKGGVSQRHLHEDKVLGHETGHPVRGPRRRPHPARP